MSDVGGVCWLRPDAAGSVRALRRRLAVFWLRRSAGRWRRAANLGLPRLLPPAPRLRSAALRAAALPDAADAPRLGLPLRLGGSALLKVVFGVLFAVGDPGLDATALTFGRSRRSLQRALLLVYPACATLYHQASSDAVFATGPRALGAPARADAAGPTTWGFVALGAGIASLVLIRPGTRSSFRSPSFRSSPPVAVARRLAWWVAACLAAAVLPLARLGRPQRRPLRRRHRRARRPSVGAVPAGPVRRPDGRTRERRSRRGGWRPHRAGGPTEEPFASSASRSTRTSPTGRTTRPSV